MCKHEIKIIGYRVIDGIAMKMYLCQLCNEYFEAETTPEYARREYSKKKGG